MELPIQPTAYRDKSYDPGFIYPKPDWGTLQAIGDSASETFTNSTLGGSLMQSGQYALADTLAKHQGLPPIEEAEFNSRFAVGGRLKWQPGMSRARAELMFENLGETVSRENRSSPGHEVASLFGGLVGSMHPVDMLFGHWVNKLTVPVGPLSQVEKLAQSLSIPKSVMESVTSGLVENTLQEGAVAASSSYRQYDYTPQDFMTGVAAGTLFSGSVGLVRSIAAVSSPGVARAMAAASVDAAMRGEDGSDAAKAASLDPRVHAHAQGEAKIRDVLDRETPVSDKDFDQATEHMRDREESAAAAANSRVEASDAANRAYAQDDGRAERPLTPEELKQQASLRAERDAYAAYRPTRAAKLTMKGATQRSRVAKLGGSEEVVATAFKNIFGTDVRFYEGTERNYFGGLGATSAHSPKTLFIEVGSLKKMIYVAGHEFAHSVRFRDPEAWMSIVNAIAKSGDGSLRKAYREAVNIQGQSRAWKTMDNAKKFDESMANVFGQAMQSDAFWNALRTDKGAFEKLVSYIQYTVRKLADILTKNASPETRAMYNDLVAILGKVDPKNQVSDAIWLNQKASKSKLQEIYSPFAKRFEAMLGEEGIKTREQAMKIDEFQDILNELAPEHGTLQDRSLELTKIERKQFLRTLDPQSFAIGVLFKKYYPEVWKKFQDDKEKSSDNGKAARRELIKNGPPFSYKQNADGSYDFFIHRNDEWNKWRENRDPMLDESVEAAVAREYADDGIFNKKNDEDTVFQALKILYGHLAYGKGETGKLVEKHLNEGRIDRGNINLGTAERPQLLYVGHLRDYLSELDGDHLRSYEDFIGGYLDFLNEKADRYLLERDEPNYQNVIDRKRDVTRFLKSAKESDASKAVDSEKFAADLRKEAEAAFEDFRKSHHLSESKLGSEGNGVPTFYVGDAVANGTPEEVAALRATVRAEVKHELDFYKMVVTETGVFTGGSEAFFTKWISDNLDKLTDERMRGIITNYDRIPSNERAANDVLRSPMSLTSRHDVDNAKENYHNNDETDPALLQQPPEQWTEDQIFDRMSVDPDEDFAAHAQRTAAAVGQQRRSKVMTELQAAMSAQRRIEAEDASVKAWRDNHAASLDASILQMLEDSELKEVFDLMVKAQEAKSPEESAVTHTALEEAKRGLSARDEELLRKIMANAASRKNKDYALQQLAKNGEFTLADPEIKRLRTEELGDITKLWLYHKDNSVDVTAALKAAEDDLKIDSLVKDFRALSHRSKLRSLLTIARRGLKNLYSRLDGLARRGVEGAGSSVAGDKHVQITHDTAAFLNALEKSGQGEAWSRNVLTRSLILEMQGHASGDPVIGDLAKLLRATSNAQMGRLNRAGAKIRVLSDYVFSTVHDRHRITKAGLDAWSSDMMGMIDWDRTFKVIGTQSKEGYLKAVYEDIVSGRLRDLDGFDPDTMGGNLASALSRQRSIYFKEAQSFDYDMKYGSGDTASLILSQIVRRAEQSVLMNHFGPDYKATWSQLVADMNFAKETDAMKSWEFRRMDATFHMLVGETDRPVNTRIAAWGQAIRSYVNVVASWASTVSSVTDLAGATSTLRFMGMGGAEVEKSLISALKEAHKRGGNQGAWMRGQGAGLQSVLGAVARLSGSELPIAGEMRRLNDLVFKYNGMNWWSRVVQESFMDISTQYLGSIASAPHYTPEFLNWLKHYDIHESEFRSMAAHATLIEGLPGKRLSPDMIKDPALARKLSLAMDDSMRYALLEPSVSDNALLRFGLKAGTVEGEAMRTILQYKSFPLALLRKVNSRFAHAYGPDGMATNGGMNRAMKEKMVMFASMMFLGWIALSIKDILRGREPMHFLSGDQWNTENLTRLVAQAGTLGLFEDLFSATESRQVSGLLGPAGGMAYNIARTAVSEGEGKANRVTNAVFNAAPFASVPFVSEGRKAVFGMVMPETLGVWDQANRKRRNTISGQGDIFLDTPTQISKE